MAAHPLPDTPPVYIINAETATDIPVVASQPLEWQNFTSFPILITVFPMNGKYPLTVNTFTVPPAHSAGAPGTSDNAVLPNAAPGPYPFTRGAVEGSGKIVVQTGLKGK
jgi:hypothetical protein